MADACNDFQFDHFLPNQPQAPLLGFLWLGTTKQGHQVRFGFAIQFAFLGPRRLRATQEGRIQPLLTKAFADALQRTPADRERLDDLRGRPAWTLGAAIDFEQNLGMIDGPSRTLAL